MKPQIIPTCLLLIFAAGCHSKMTRNSPVITSFSNRFLDDQSTEDEVHVHQNHDHNYKNMVDDQDNAVMAKWQPSRPKWGIKKNAKRINSVNRGEIKSAIMKIMQNVLCKNFPSIPCHMIAKDKTLQKLIEKSLAQITTKQLEILEKPGASVRAINSEELSSFLTETKTGYFTKMPKDKMNNKKLSRSLSKQSWPQEDENNGLIKKDQITKGSTQLQNRKKIRKYFPHKIKFGKPSTFIDDLDKISVEVPDIQARDKTDMDSPRWRIDYSKHGTPSRYVTENLFGKVMVGSNMPHNTRREVLHPDIHIKSFLMKKSSNNNS